jgi:hypothetical protein
MRQSWRQITVLKSAVWLLLTIFAPCAVYGMQPTHNFSDKTVPELLALLESNDSKVRHCAAIFIGDRYRNPKEIVVNGPIHKPNSPAPEFPIPSRVIPALTAHLKTDADWTVRVCALGALEHLRYHTNTTPIVALALDDKDASVRVRACAALLQISQDYSESLHARVIPTLKACLDPKGETEQLWYSAWTAGEFGTNGVVLLPALRVLTTHDSPKVRRYAEEALLRIKLPNESAVGERRH